MNKKLLCLIRPLFYLVFISFFSLLPITAVAQRSFCIYYNVAHILCPGCGVTRAFVCFLHLDFTAAFYYNPFFTLAVFPVAILMMLQDTIIIFIRLLTKKNRVSMLEFLFLLLCRPFGLKKKQGKDVLSDGRT